MIELTDISIFLKDYDNQESKLKAYVTITLSSCFVVRGIKVIEGANGLFLSMPSLQKKDGTFQNIAHPINKDARAFLEKEILETYKNEVQKQTEENKNEVQKKIEEKI